MNLNKSSKSFSEINKTNRNEFDINKSIEELFKDNVKQKYKHEKKSFKELLDYCIEIEIDLYNYQKQLENNKFEIMQLSQIVIDKDSEIIELKIKINHLENKEKQEKMIPNPIFQNLTRNGSYHSKQKANSIISTKENNRSIKNNLDESNQSVIVDLSLDKQENQSLLSNSFI